jgi:hypothetical protein
MKTIINITISLLAIAGMAQGQDGQRRVSSGSASATMTLTVCIPAKADITLTDPISNITVTTRDLNRGYVDVPNAYSFTLWSNSSQGATVNMIWSGLIVNDQGESYLPNMLKYRVSGQGSYHAIEKISQPVFECWTRQQHEKVSIDLRLMLVKGMSPGNYSCQAQLAAVPHTGMQVAQDDDQNTQPAVNEYTLK